MAIVIHVQHASTQYSDSDLQFTDDAAKILGRGADLIGWTEISTKRAVILRRQCLLHGYVPITPHGRGDCAIAVRSRFATIADQGVDFAVASSWGGGKHSTRANVWVAVDCEAGRLSYNVNHWLTGYNREPARRKAVLRQTDVLIKRVQAQGKGSAIALWSGDINVDLEDRGDARPYQILEDAGLVPVYKELDRWPATHGRRTIDLIGSYDPDRRVRARDVKVWPDHTHIDHQQVSAWYDIARPKEAA